MLGPVFSDDQENLLAERSRRDGFARTVLRPDLVVGFGLGSPMNLLAGIGVYAACDEIYNVTNGDNFRRQHLWQDVADVFAMPTAPRQPMSPTDQMADKEPAWERLVDDHGLVPTPWARIAPWEFADGIFSAGLDMVQSTIRIRRAGFHDCRDSHRSLVEHLEWLRKERYLP